MGKIYMTACMKGGCAKTVTTYNLAYSLQKLGKKVLAVDFDSQANLSTCFGVEDPAAVPVTIGHLMMAQIDDEKLPAPEEYIMSRNGVDFIPSSMVLSAVDAKLRLEMGAEKMLSGILEPLRDRYDAIIIDTAPTLGALNINALAAADEVIITVNPQLLAMMGLQDFLKTVKKIKSRINDKLDVAGILLTIVEGRHEGIVTKEEFLRAQEIFCKQRKTKKVIPKTYPLYRKVKCGTCGRAMTYKTYSFRGEEYKYFGCPHAKEQVGDDGCCKRYITEDNLNAIVWSVVRQLLDMTDTFKKKLDKQNSISRQDNLILAEKLSRLQQEKEKCESDRFANVDQFMAGQLDKDVYQRRRADLGRLAERLEADIAELEQKLKAAETVKDDSLSQALGMMKKYSGADELTQAMVQELIEKVVVTDPEHVEIVWKFKDEVWKFIGM